MPNVDTHATPPGREKPWQEPGLTLEEILERDPMAEMSSELVSRFATQIIEAFTEKGMKMHMDPNEVYKRHWGTLMVRRESPQRLVGALVNGQDIPVRFTEESFGKKYLNSAVWNNRTRPETLRWAIQEGFSKGGGLFMVEAFDPNGKDLKVEKVETVVQQLPTPSGEVIDRTTYRATSGQIHPEDLRFVLLGVVARRFPRERMTHDERDRLEDYEDQMDAFEEGGRRGKRPDPVFILRAFTFDGIQEQAA